MRCKMHNDASVPPSAAVRLHLEGPIFALLDDGWRSYEKIPSGSKALRLLIDLALAADPVGRQPSELRRRPSAPSRATTNSTQRFETAPATSPTYKPKPARSLRRPS